jgi:uncharacterized protein (DUF362 family)
MVQGVSAKFTSYEESVPRFLQFIKFEQTLKGRQTIVLKPSLKNARSHNTPVAFTENVLKFCLAHKDAGTEVIIAEGSDGDETMDVFEQSGYRRLAETYGISLVDLNDAEVEEVYDSAFTIFENILYPKILLKSYLVVLPRLAIDEETGLQDSLSSMLGAYPATYYRGLFSSTKSKLRRDPIKYAIHDIVRCKIPDASLIDASDYGVLLAGKPLELDKQAARIVGKDWRTIQHLRLIDESTTQLLQAQQAREAAKLAKQAQQAATASN